jgi:isoquinoline 1-oxidoreductase alpha subunit
MKISLRVNGESRELDVDGQTPLLWVLRDELNMTGTKFGCGKAQCGACTVHINGNAMRSCVMPISAVANSDVTTIEGIDSKAAAAVSKAWQDLDVPQCGFCQSGQIMSAVNLLTNNPNPTDADIDASMSGNLCRCATYVRIRQAIKNAAAELEA